MSEKEEAPRFTDEFRSSVVDFTKDLTTTFPEYSVLIEKWSDENTNDDDYQKLFEYCLKIYPERFFDILNQDVSIFSEESNVNVSFFPGLNFKTLYNCEGVSDKTRETVWKYLQVVLLILVKSMKNKMNFGDAMDIFNKMDVSDLQGQLETTVLNVSKFFNDVESKEENKDEENKDESTPSANTKSPLPNVEDIREHLQFLFNGKIGKLAKELADDMSSDLAETFGSGLDNVNSTADVLSALMKNPEKLGGIVNTVKDKLANKMESGDITKEELMKEASEMMNKMQGLGDNLGGMGDMGKMFKGMAGMGGGDMGDMGKMFKDMAKSMGMNIPKGARMDTNAMNEAQKKTTVKERLKSRALARKQEEVVKQLEAEAVRIQRERDYAKFQLENPDMEKTIFALDNEKQEKSAVRDPSVLSAGQKKRMKKKARKEKENESTSV